MLNSTNIKPIGYDFPDIEEHDDELEILYEQRRMERSMKLINDIFSINVERIRINVNLEEKITETVTWFMNKGKDLGYFVDNVVKWTNNNCIIC